MEIVLVLTAIRGSLLPPASAQQQSGAGEVVQRGLGIPPFATKRKLAQLTLSSVAKNVAPAVCEREKIPNHGAPGFAKKPGESVGHPRSSPSGGKNILSTFFFTALLRAIAHFLSLQVDDFHLVFSVLDTTPSA